MRIVGKSGERYMVLLDMEEIMAFFPETTRPPVAALKDGEEYNVKDWINRVYQSELSMMALESAASSVKHHQESLSKTFKECFHRDPI